MVDIENAHEINKNFQEWLVKCNKENIIPETNVRVLCKAHWPTFKNLQLALPLELSNSQQTFKDYYSQSNQFRGLEFVYPLCNVVVQGNLLTCNPEITMSLIQYMVLQYFDRVKGATFKELSFDLSIDSDTLKKTLHSLVSICIRTLNFNMIF